ncbi:MAG: sigma-70 family RNA polymerase sigma factor [Dokdonella sp.]|nr:sigma-70 family RNA polymerase sigma factor [Dokdonella sp.]
MHPVRIGLGATFPFTHGTYDEQPLAGGRLLNAPHEHRSNTPPSEDTRAEASARDLEWLRRVAGGDRVAFERLYLHHHGRLTRFLARHTARRDLVEEIVNETMWVVWRSAGEFRGDAKVATWIIGIAYRRLMKALRDRPEPLELPTTLPDEAGDGPGEAEQRELRDWVRHGLLALPPDQRMTMELAYYLGQSCEEIAAIMDVAVGTVKARLFHARVRLRNTLPALGGDTPPDAHAARG